jgi:hypothetical protein
MTENDPTADARQLDAAAYREAKAAAIRQSHVRPATPLPDVRGLSDNDYADAYQAAIGFPNDHRRRRIFGRTTR